MADPNDIIANFFGDKDFSVHWKSEEEKKLHWFCDDLHCPNPVSPMYFDVGGWWGPTCEYLYRRFGAPFGKGWEGKKINGYVYSAVLPRQPQEAANIAPYYGLVMPSYAANFLDWWQTRYLPEVKRNLEYLDNFPAGTATLAELMIHLEEALDIQERHFRLHWILNLAQFQASIDFGTVVGEVFGQVDQALIGRIMISIKDRNWDSVEGMWKLKEEAKHDPELKSIFEGGQTAAAILPALEKSSKGRTYLKKIDAYAKEFGVRAMYTHEYVYKLWVEDHKPIIEMIKGYLANDYDFPAVYNAAKQDQAKAIQELRAMIPKTATEEQKAKFENALSLVLRMMPLTPDHHFYFDQGTYGRLRLLFLAIGRHLKKIGLMDDPEDIFYLEYEQLRWYVANPRTNENPNGYDGRSVIKKNRREREEAWKLHPRDWVGTVTQWSLYQEPYKTLWGYPQRFERAQEKATEPKDVVKGLPAAAGVAEGVARIVTGPEEFDQVKKGEIMVCIMTNPAWVMVFTKIAAVVCDAGGVLAHPAVVAREFGIPAVVGTTNSTQRIKTGDRIRVNGSTGVVDILKRS
jgi:phosphohistidine swiveling domain-containing protein